MPSVNRLNHLPLHATPITGRCYRSVFCEADQSDASGMMLAIAFFFRHLAHFFSELVGHLRDPKRVFHCLLWFGIAISLSATSRASTVLEVSFDEAASQSELIFEGRVVSAYTRISTQTGQPFTYFELHILDIIKGTYAQPTITLGYLGGTKDGYVLRVSDMRMPTVGEHGIYFVESPSREQVHPLFGWQQWHLLVYVDPADGVEKVKHVEGPQSRQATSPAYAPIKTLEQIKSDIRSVVGPRR